MTIFRTAKRIVLSSVSAGLAWLMTSSRTLEKLVAMSFRCCGRWRVARSLARHSFTAFQTRVARSGNSLRIIKLRANTQMKLPLHDYCGGLYFDPSGFEPRTVRFVVEHLQHGDVFIDIGANIGYFTLIAGSVLREKGGGQVLAFEPNPTVSRLLADSVRLSHLEEIITLFPWAVSRAEGGSAIFYLANGTNTGLSSLKPWESHLESGVLSGDRTIQVECRNLDALYRDGHIRRADFMKIDVESAELDVLAGGVMVLERLRPRYIICETSLDSEATTFLRARGYDVNLLEPLNPNSPGWGNVLFTAHGASAQVNTPDKKTTGLLTTDYARLHED